MTHVSAHDNWVGMDGSLPSVREALENTWQTLLLWQRRYSDRRALFGLDDRINTALFPPFFLVAHGVERRVVRGAERHDPLVAHLASHGPGLGKT